MPTLLLTSRQTEDAQRLWRACIQARWKVERVHGWRVPEVNPKEVAVYGEPLFAHHVAQTLGLELVQPAADWLAKLSRRWSGRDVRFATLAEARLLTSSAFIKPAEDKSFDARIYSSGTELPQADALPDSLPVLIEGIVDWEIEFRCFVLDRKVLTASVYWRDGALAKNANETWNESESETLAAIRFCESALADPSFSVPDAAVVDVGLIRNQGWAVIECNAAWGSGIYGCDATQVLSVLESACRAKTRQ